MKHLISIVLANAKKWWLHPDMTEKWLTGMYNYKTNNYHTDQFVILTFPCKDKNLEASVVVHVAQDHFFMT